MISSSKGSSISITICWWRVRVHWSNCNKKWSKSTSNII